MRMREVDLQGLLAEVAKEEYRHPSGDWKSLVPVIDGLREKGFSWGKVFVWLRDRQLTRSKSEFAVRSSYFREKGRIEKKAAAAKLAWETSDERFKEQAPAAGSVAPS